MVIDRTGFLLMASVLAVGGVGGWALHDSGVGTRIKRDLVSSSTPTVKGGVAARVEPSPVVVEIKAPQLTCDDSVGLPEECPAVGPSDEGVCSNVLAKRCADYKLAFKPKVAQQAVACLRQLQGAERCDPARINLCGHSALMAACPEPEPPAKGTYVKATGTTPASFTLNEDPKATPSPLMAACESISKTCPGQNLNECKQTLTGMTDRGRASMIECMASHCRDKGLIGCEAVQSVPAQSQALRQ